MAELKIRAKERDAIIQSLSTGVTPRVGIQHIQVGRITKLKHCLRTLSVSLLVGLPFG